MKYSIIIPCYNEADNLSDLVDRVKELVDFGNTEIILVENGSKDNSVEVLKKMKKIDGKKIKVVFVPQNKGYGYGLLQGLKMASGNYVGWLHADLQVAPKEMIRLMSYVEQYKGDKLLFLKGKRKNRSLYDCFFTAGMTLYETIVLGHFVNDIGAIPVLFDKGLLSYFDNAPYNFSIELFSFYQAKKNGYFVKRFPVIMKKREKGDSSWNKGLSSKIRLSVQMMKDGIAIRQGKKVR